MYRHFRIARHAHIYTYKYIINLWASFDLWSLFGAFSDRVSNAFLVLLEIIFLTRVHKAIFEKIDYMVLFRAAPGVLVARGTLKNGAIKKTFAQKLFLSTKTTFGKCTRKMKHFYKITSTLTLCCLF